MIERHRSTGIAFADPDSWISIITWKLPSGKTSRFISQPILFRDFCVVEESPEERKIFNFNPETFLTLLGYIG